jgi:O-succinylbenzoic acid--CoA ligase
MAGQPGATLRPVPLRVVSLARSAAAAAITAAWDHGEAVAVLDPAAPPALTDDLVAVVDPAAGVEPDVAAVVVTSGTTGTPKAVELTTDGRAAIGHGFAAALGTEPDDRWLVCLPLHHVAGLAILARARVSGASVVVDDGFDVARVATAARDDGVSLVSLVPTMLHRLLDAGAPLHELRRIVVGGAPMAPALRSRAERAGANVVDAYGLSETWGGVAIDGIAIPGMEVGLADDGEILVRGPAVMRRYRGLPDATAAAFTPDGAFRTGDVGVLEDGRIRVVDRARDLVISGGVNVSPTAVESVLSEHPDLVDVCVVGAPDDEWGERVVAFVVVRDGSVEPPLAALRDFAGARLSKPQLPREVVVVDAIPRTPGGKARRRELRRP